MPDQNTPRYTHDERLTEAQREQYDAAQHALQGRGGGGDSGGIGAAGAVMTPVILIGSAVVFMLYACFFPVAATVALITGIIVSKVFDLLVPGVGWIAHFLVMLPLAFSALMLFRQRVEWRLEQMRVYVLARHALRLVFTAVIVGLSATFLTETDKLRDRAALDQSYSWTHFAIVVAAVAIVHFVGRWYDRRFVLPMVAGARSPETAPARPASRYQLPVMESAPAPLRRGLPAMTLAGGAFGAFLGYAAFETPTSTLVGLFAGCIGGALLMFLCWLITRPVGALFDRVPLLWPVLMGGIVGAGVAWRLASADKASLAVYLAPGVVGGALVLTVPYVLYVVARRVVARPA